MHCTSDGHRQKYISLTEARVPTWKEILADRLLRKERCDLNPAKA